MKQQELGRKGIPNLPGQPRRFYMAGLGRFTTRVREREWLGGENPYGYAKGNPVTWKDSKGLQPETAPGQGPFDLKPWPIHDSGVRWPGNFISPLLPSFNIELWGYGNWCGKNRPGVKSKPNLGVIDDLDKCCYCHDKDQGTCMCGGYTGRAHHNLVDCANKVKCKGPNKQKCEDAKEQLIMVFELIVIPACVGSNGKPKIDQCFGPKPPCSDKPLPIGC